MRIATFLILAASLVLALSQSANAEGKCRPIRKELPKLLANRTSAGDIYTLRNKEGAKFILLMENFHKDSPPNKNGFVSPWYLLTRNQSRDPSIYYETGHGRRVQILQDVHDGTPRKKYGLPGSGFPRCADNILDAIDLRVWANKELGKSYIFYLKASDEKQPSYMLLVSTDGAYWTLLAYPEGGASYVCYRARGDSTLIDSFTAPN